MGVQANSQRAEGNEQEGADGGSFRQQFEPNRGGRARWSNAKVGKTVASEQTSLHLLIVANRGAGPVDQPDVAKGDDEGVFDHELPGQGQNRDASKYSRGDAEVRRFQKQQRSLRVLRASA